MYETLLGNGHAHTIGGWKADIRDYARWEYGSEDAARWLLRSARVARRKRTPILSRMRAWFRPVVELRATTAIAIVENRPR